MNSESINFDFFSEPSFGVFRVESQIQTVDDFLVVVDRYLENLKTAPITNSEEDCKYTDFGIQIRENPTYSFFEVNLLSPERFFVHFEVQIKKPRFLIWGGKTLICYCELEAFEDLKNFASLFLERKFLEAERCLKSVGRILPR